MKQNQLTNFLLDQSKDLFWMIDLNYQLIYANATYLNLMKQITGVEKKLNETALVEGFGEGFVEKWTGYYNRALKGDYFEIEEHFLNPELTEIQYNQITFDPLTGDDNKLFAIACQSKDITSIVKKRSESEQRFKALIQEGSDLIGILDAKGNYLYVSPTSTTVLGIAPEKFIGKNALTFVHPDDAERTLCNIRKISTQNKVMVKPFRIQNHNKEWRWIETVLTNMLDNPAVNGIVANSRDITEEKKLRELNRQASNLSKIGSWEIDLVTQRLFWSDEVHQLHETNSKSFVPNLEIGINFYREDFRTLVRFSIEKCIATKAPFDFEAVLVTDKKKEVWVRAIGNGEFVNGVCTRIYGTFQDINSLRESENRLLYLSDNLPGVVYQYLIHPDGTDSLRHVSGGAKQLWGFTSNQLTENITLFWDQIKAGGDFEEVQSSIQTSIETKTKWTSRFKYVMPTGELSIHLGNGSPLFMSDGTIVFNAIMLDVTNETKNEALLAQASEMSRIGSWELDLISQDGDSMYWSPMVREILEVDDSYNPTLSDALEFYRGKNIDKVQLALTNLITHGLAFDEEILMRTHKGQERWIRVIGNSENVDNKRTKIYGSLQDINEKKVAEEKLEKSFEEKNNILESIGDAFFAVDNKGVVTYWNKKAELILGSTKEQMVGKFLWEEYADSIDTVFFSAFETAMETRQATNFEAYSTKLNIWLEVAGYPSEEGLSVYFKDVTSRKKAEEEKNILRETLDNSVNEIYIFDADTLQFSYVNKGALLNIGYSEKEINTLTPLEIKPEFTVASFKELIAPLVNNEEDKIIFFSNHKRKDGSFYPVEVHLQLVTEGNNKRFLAIILNITERKKAEEAIIQANERYEKVTEATNDAIWDWDIENLTYYRSKGIERFFGKETSGSFPESKLWARDYFHEDDIARIKNSFYKAIENVLTTRWELQYRVINEFNEILYVADRAVIVRNSKGKAIRVVGAMTDISEQKQMTLELSELNQSLQQHSIELLRSNEELEQFAFVASHDLQEPLRMISSFMELLHRKYGDLLDEKGHQYIHFATDGAKRMRQIILDLLEYSRSSKQTEGKEVVDMNEVLLEFKQLRRKLISEKKATITAHALPIFNTYKAAITQILHCLLDNSLKYSLKGIPPMIAIAMTENAKEWQFSIKDNGIGIDPQFFSKIFIIFQRLHNKDDYEGTGIGLSICKRHVEFLGGKIWLESAPGKGTSFYFTIPKIKNNE